MNIVDTIVEVFRKNLTAVFEKEADPDKNYMNQTILGNRWRAFWGIFVAVKMSMKEMVDVLTYAIAKHRQEEHDEDNNKEMEKLSRGLTVEQTSASSSWWKA